MFSVFGYAVFLSCSCRTHPYVGQGALSYVHKLSESPVLLKDPLFTVLLLLHEMVKHSLRVFPVKSQLEELFAVWKEFHM